MKKLLSCVAFIMTMVMLAGCEWGSSGGDSSWSDSYSWVNFAGVYRPIAGKEYLVQKPGTSSNTPGSLIETTQSLGSGDGNQASFGGELAHRPIAVGTVVVRAGAWSMADGSGSGNLSGAEGSGTINYSTGVITVNWNLAPGVGVNVIVTYSYSAPGTGGNPSGPTSGSSTVKIYSMTVTQTGQHLDIIDSNGVRYNGKITNLSQTGGDKTGNTSGLVIANFAAKNDAGVELVGAFNGTYLSPRENTSGDDDLEETNIGGRMAGAKAEDDDEEATVTTGIMANRQMQGTYIGADGNTGEILGQSGKITVTVTN